MPVPLPREAVLSTSIAGAPPPRRGKVRDVYVDASGEDSRSLDLEERMREVTLMLAQLKKDSAIAEK